MHSFISINDVFEPIKISGTFSVRAYFCRQQRFANRFCPRRIWITTNMNTNESVFFDSLKREAFRLKNK